MKDGVKKIIKISSLSLIFVFILVYAIFRSHSLIFGIKIKNVNLIDGSRVENSVLKITGQAENAVDLTLNGREISVDEEGNFNETIVLLSGYNIVSIKAKDKFGYLDEKDYKLIY